MSMKRLLHRYGLFLVAFGFIAGCDDPIQPVALLDSGTMDTPDARAARFMKLVRTSLPGRVLDAQFFEVVVSGGSFLPGPGETEFFARFTIEPADRANWLAVTSGIPKPTDKPAVPANVTWWMTSEEAANAIYYDPKPLFGHANGFIAATKDAGIFYVWTFTL